MMEKKAPVPWVKMFNHSERYVRSVNSKARLEYLKELISKGMEKNKAIKMSKEEFPLIKYGE